MATIDLGGPGAPCSVTRVRRLKAGELTGDEKAKTAAHILACERCRATERELQAEQERVLRDVPFESFAAGVAERLAAEPRRLRLPSWAPLAAAACLLVGIAVPMSMNQPQTEERGEREKGFSLAHLYVKDARGIRSWLPGEPIAEDADVHAELRPGSNLFAAVVLAEGNEVHPLFSGLARGEGKKPRVVSFGWTGAHGATLVIALDKQPIDIAKLAAAVRASPQKPSFRSAQLDTVALRRK
jgi:hypothetical protein